MEKSHSLTLDGTRVGTENRVPEWSTVDCMCRKAFHEIRLDSHSAVLYAPSMLSSLCDTFPLALLPTRKWNSVLIYEKSGQKYFSNWNIRFSRVHYPFGKLARSNLSQALDLVHFRQPNTSTLEVVIGVFPELQESKVRTSKISFPLTHLEVIDF